MPSPVSDDTASAAACYRSHVIARLPEVLSLGNREPMTASFGGFDRNFWAWKFTDFAGARFQEAAYCLAHLWRHAWPGNTLAGAPLALEWARGSIRYWQRLQHADGSFDEAYPFERSLAATAFTGFYVGEAYGLIETDLPAADKAAMRASLAKAGDWLIGNDERHGVLSNHLAAAAAALTVIHRICGEARFERRARYFLDRIYARQSAEGWYEEYGGADPGYQSHGSFYLARIWQITGDAALLDSLRRAVKFQSFFVHPDGTIGGEYGSRNTEFYFPAAFEMLAATVPDAAAIAQAMRDAVATQSCAGLAAVDSYNLFPMLNNYLFAAEHAVGIETAPPLPCCQQGEWTFPDAGLLVKATPRYFAIVGLSKGGVVKAFDTPQRRIATSDCGWWLRLGDGRLVSHQALRRPARWRRDGDALVVEADFTTAVERTMSPWLFIAFRAFCLTVGRVRRVAYWVKELLVKALVTRQDRRVPLHIERRIEFAEDTIVIRDRIANPRRLAVMDAGVGEKFASIHMGSARYFQPNELATGGADGPAGDVAATLSNSDSAEVARRWRFEPKPVSDYVGAAPRAPTTPA